MQNRSVRGEARGVFLDRRIGDVNGLRRRLFPGDRLGLARERAGQNLVHARDRDDVEPLLMLSLISTRSLAFSSGISTVLMPPRWAASSFSFKPPIGSTRPRSVISPVMA